MAYEQSRFFDYTEDKPAEYQADEFAEFFRTFLSDGVPVLGTNLQITATDEGMFVKADYGAAMIQGYGYWLKDDETGLKQLDIAAAHATYTRIDRIVLRRDKSVSVANISMVVLTGTPSAMPASPALTRAGNIYEISLAQVRVDPGVLSITADKVTDERADTYACGYVENLSVREQIAAIYTALVTGLAAKANASHTQGIDTIAGLQTALNALTAGINGKISAAAGTIINSYIADGSVTKSKTSFVSENGYISLGGALGLLINSFGTGDNALAAGITFHRVGKAAINFGMDVDNVLKVGGYSFGNNAYALFHEGNHPKVFFGTSPEPPAGTYVPGTVYYEHEA